MFDPDAIERMRAMQRDWEANELREFLERQPESRPEYRTGSLLPVERVYTPRRRRRHGPRGARPAGPVSLHARAVPDHVPGTALDDAADRGLRDGKRYQQALSLPDRTRTNGTFG